MAEEKNSGGRGWTILPDVIKQLRARWASSGSSKKHFWTNRFWHVPWKDFHSRKMPRTKEDFPRAEDQRGSGGVHHINKLFVPPASFKQDTRFACAVGAIRAMENELLDRNHFTRLIDAADTEEIYKIFSDTDYGFHIDEPKDIHEFENFLTKELDRVLDILHRMSPDPGWIDLFCKRYDFHNLKVIIKGHLLDEDPTMALGPPGLVDVGVLDGAVENKEYDKLPLELKNAALAIDSHLDEGGDIQTVDILADCALYEHLYQETTDDVFLSGLIRIYCDLINIKTFLRVRNIKGSQALLKKSLLPAGELDHKRFTDAYDTALEEFSQSLVSTSYAEVVTNGIGDFIKDKKFSTLEKLSDNFVVKYLSQSVMVAFGKEPLVNYLLSKENEMKVLRIILVGKLNNLPATVIRERLI